MPTSSIDPKLVKLLNENVSHFNIEYSDNTVDSDCLPRNGSVHLRIILTMTKSADVHALKNALRTYGITPRDTELDNTPALCFPGNYNDEFFNVMAAVLTKREKKAHTNIFKRAIMALKPNFLQNRSTGRDM